MLSTAVWRTAKRAWIADGQKRTPCTSVRLALAAAGGLLAAMAGSGSGTEPDDSEDGGISAGAAVDVPSRYFLNATNVTQFCKPIRTAFSDAASTSRVVDGLPKVWHLNGAYGLPMLEVRGQELFHSGTDIGWFREGDPVFAVADGVVRESSPALRAVLAEQGVRLRTRKPVDYGNAIVIEHQINDRSYFTLYGHLDTDRLVKTGDLVSAGQQIGTIGRNSGIVNGGYTPHLHFAVHDGKLPEPGARVATVRWDEEEYVITLERLSETELSVRVPEELSFARIRLRAGAVYELERAKSGDSLPAAFAWRMPGRVPAIAGYVPSLEGFYDPMLFVRDCIAGAPQASHYFVSAERSLDLPFTIGGSGVEWAVDEWFNVPDANGPTLEGLRGRVVCLFLFQLSCSGSKTHGLPTFVTVAREHAGSGDVAVIGLQTTFGAFGKNSVNNLRPSVEQLRVSVPVGHIREVGDEFVAGYGQRGTPWVVLIDREGIIQFSNYCVRPEEVERRIQELVAAEREVPNALAEDE